MDYRDLRKKFVELSGRYDLIKANETDNGADFFINEGQKWLDRKFSDGKAKARYPSATVEGTIKVSVAGLRAAKEVWVTNSEGMTELARESLNSLRNAYQDTLSDVTNGRPSYYAPAVFRPYPDTLTSAAAAALSDVEDLLLDGTHYTYNGIVILPPADGVYTLTIQGLFYSPTLSSVLTDGSWIETTSFWLQVHPGTLLLAALYKLEAFYRSRAGMRDRMEALMEDVTGIDHDLVETDIAGESLQMGG